ncbi:MAG: hypothetical protein NXI24_18225 [bacterium]|nr:hypothetical protein [bacterium]
MNQIRNSIHCRNSYTRRSLLGLAMICLIVLGTHIKGDAGLSATQRNGQVVRTNGADPRHVCPALDHETATAGVDESNAPKHRVPGDVTLERLTRETRELLSEISVGHRKLLQASPSLGQGRHLIVLKDMAYGLDRADLVGERTVVAIRYKDGDAGQSENLRCVILDHTMRNHDNPGRWIRRITRVRLGAQNEIDVRFETLGHNLHATLSLRELETPTRIRASRKILSYLRDVRYVIDRTLPALSARTEFSIY